LKGGAWYLVARRSAGMRVYRVSRVAGVRKLEEPCMRPPEFELAAFWDEWSRNFEQGLPRVEVTVRVSEDVRRHLGPDQRVGADGNVVLGFQSLGDAHRELLRFGSDVEVLEPPELRDAVARTAAATAALYAA
jgi:predicted DNA-binding transcriptional regulator YafY